MSARSAFHWKSPIFRSLDGYRWSWLPKDLGAGALIVAVAIPLSMGMAEVAGMPPVTGLYCCLLPLVAYALLGSSRQLVIALDASTAAMLAAAVAPLASGPERYAQLAALVALLVGVMLIVAGTIRIGFLADFLSEPLLIGYQAGLAIVVASSQLPKLLGIPVESGTTLGSFAEIVTHVDQTDLATLAIGLGCIAMILIARGIGPAVPGALIALAASALAVSILEPEGVAVLGTLPQGLPTLGLPSLSAKDVADLWMPAVAIAFIAAADTIVSSRAFARRGGYSVSADADMVGLGAANIASGVSGGISVSASAARTAVAESVGSRSQVAGVAAAAMMALVLVALTPLMTDVPQPALAAVVLVAIARLVEVGRLRTLWRVSRAEFAIAATTTLGAVIFGLLEGIVIAVVLYLFQLMRRLTRPHDAVVGWLEGRAGTFDIARFPDAQTEPGLLVYRFEGPLFTANAPWFAKRVRSLVDREPGIRWLAFEMAAVTDVDVTAASVLEELTDDLKGQGVRVVICDVLAHVMDQLRASSGSQGQTAFFDSASDVREAFRSS